MTETTLYRTAMGVRRVLGLLGGRAWGGVRSWDRVNASSIGCQSLWDAQHRRLCNDPPLTSSSTRMVAAAFSVQLKQQLRLSPEHLVTYLWWGSCHSSSSSPKSPTCGGLASWPALEGLSSAQTLAEPSLVARTEAQGCLTAQRDVPFGCHDTTYYTHAHYTHTHTIHIHTL